MLHHPMPEIVQLTLGLRAQLKDRYPSSGFELSLASVSGVDNKNEALRDVRQEWEWRAAESLTYSALTEVQNFTMRADFRLSRRYMALLTTRPRGCVLPHRMSDLGQAYAEFLLDFGSFRDLQRHRNGVCRMPLLDTSYGFEAWYLEQLGDLRAEAEALIDEQRDAINRLGDGPKRTVLRQYYTALGFRVPCNVMYALPALLYVMELRSGKTVHPTLRKQVHAMVRAFQRDYPDIVLHVDMDPDDWDVRRGDQTITEKNA
jgi:hypothetical protein